MIRASTHSLSINTLSLLTGLKIQAFQAPGLGKTSKPEEMGNRNANCFTTPYSKIDCKMILFLLECFWSCYLRCSKLILSNIHKCQINNEQKWKWNLNKILNWSGRQTIFYRKIRSKLPVSETVQYALDTRSVCVLYLLSCSLSIYEILVFLTKFSFLAKTR